MLLLLGAGVGSLAVSVAVTDAQVGSATLADSLVGSAAVSDQLADSAT